MLTLPADLQSLGIRDVVAIDAEYISRKGGHVVPVCFCAKSLVNGEEWRVFNKMDTSVQSVRSPMIPKSCS